MAQIVQSKLDSCVAACLLMQLPDVDHVSGRAPSGGETPLIADPTVEHSQSILGERQGSSSRTRFPFRHEGISLRQMDALGLEAEHLGGPHAGFEDQYADIAGFVRPHEDMFSLHYERGHACGLEARLTFLSRSSDCL